MMRSTAHETVSAIGWPFDDGEVTVPSTEKFLRDYMESFHVFIARVLSVLPRGA